VEVLGSENELNDIKIDKSHGKSRGNSGVRS